MNLLMSVICLCSHRRQCQQNAALLTGCFGWNVSTGNILSVRVQIWFKADIRDISSILIDWPGQGTKSGTYGQPSTWRYAMYPSVRSLRVVSPLIDHNQNARQAPQLARRVKMDVLYGWMSSRLRKNSLRRTSGQTAINQACWQNSW
jgi:hypothetical protein